MSDPDKAKCYLLINVHAGHEDEVEIALTNMAEIIGCDQVTGEADLIAIAQAEDYQHLLGDLLTKIRHIEGISQTSTCLVL